MPTIKHHTSDETDQALRSTGNALDVVVDQDQPPTTVQPSLGDPVHSPGPVSDDETER